MNLFYWINIFHVMSASILLSALIITIFYFTLSTHAAFYTETKKQIKFVAHHLMMPALLFQLISGIALTLLKKYDFGSVWITCSFIAFSVLLFCALTNFLWVKKRSAQRLLILIECFMLAIIFYLMINRP